MIDCNTTSKFSTHFLAPVQLIKEARNVYKVSSENWPYPTSHKYGQPRDKYYAEIWEDGMDYQNSFWIIEANNYEDPKCYPLLIFEDHENFDLFNTYDLMQLFMAIMHYRRDLLWIKQNDLGIYSDEVWPFLEQTNSNDLKTPGMKKFVLEHASQSKVEFWLNVDFIPNKLKEAI